MGSHRTALPFTTELEELLASAQRTALESTHAAVTIEHLLLAFVDAPRATELLRIDTAPLMTLRGQLVSRLMQDVGDPTTFGKLPPNDPDLTEVLDGAEAHSRTLGIGHVDPGSVIAALLETGSPVATWLRDLGVTVPTPPPAPRVSEVPPPLPPRAIDDEDVSDGPTEEAMAPAEGVRPPSSGEPFDDDETGFEEWAAPTKVVGGLERDVRKKRAESPPEEIGTEEPTAEEPRSRDLRPGRADGTRGSAPASAGRALPPIDPHLKLPGVPDPNAFPSGGESFASPTRGRPSPDADQEPTTMADPADDVRGGPRTSSAQRAGSSGVRSRPAPSLVDETLDFDEDATPTPAKLPPARRGGSAVGDEEFSVPAAQPPPDIAEGELVENIPRRMRVDQPQTIQVRLGKRGTPNLARGMAREVQTHELKVTQAMSARLVAPDGGFSIELTSPETQWIDDPSGLRGTPAEWTWCITPTKPGKRPLQLVVGARTVRDGIIADAALPMQIIEVEVVANHGRTALQAAQWLVATLIGAVLGVFSEEILKWAQGMTDTQP